MLFYWVHYVTLNNLYVNWKLYISKCSSDFLTLCECACCISQLESSCDAVFARWSNNALSKKVRGSKVSFFLFFFFKSMLTDQLTRQGPLARVWLASHWERKLSKSQFLQTNIEKTIGIFIYKQYKKESKTKTFVIRCHRDKPRRGTISSYFRSIVTRCCSYLFKKNKIPFGRL